MHYVAGMSEIKISMKRDESGFEMSTPAEYLGFVRVEGDSCLTFKRTGSLHYAGTPFPAWHWAAYAGRTRFEGFERTALAAVRKVLTHAKSCSRIFGGA